MARNKVPCIVKFCRFTVAISLYPEDTLIRSCLMFENDISIFLIEMSLIWRKTYPSMVLFEIFKLNSNELSTWEFSIILFAILQLKSWKSSTISSFPYIPNDEFEEIILPLKDEL